jgi:ureidoglycolate hydrolase
MWLGPRCWWSAISASAGKLTTDHRRLATGDWRLSTRVGETMIELRRITPESFARYGQVLVWDAAQGQRLQVATEESAGAPWMLATFRVDAHEITYLAEHPDSIELFAPLSGVAVLLLALPEAPESYEAFLLDVPVVINRGVWHGMCALSEAAILGIAENVEAGGSRRYLDRPLRVGLVWGQ